VAQILRRAVDVEGVGRFILGRWWRQASPAQQQEYLQLFEQVLIRNLSARFGEYQGVRFGLGRTQQRTEDDALVTTVVERPNTPAFALDWRVAEVGVISRNNGNVGALLAAMRNQIQQLASREAG
jgi:phospholipid transport system substrate-binding protein